MDPAEDDRGVGAAVYDDVGGEEKGATGSGGAGVCQLRDAARRL